MCRFASAMLALLFTGSAVAVQALSSEEMDQVTAGDSDSAAAYGPGPLEVAIPGAVAQGDGDLVKVEVGACPDGTCSYAISSSGSTSSASSSSIAVSTGAAPAGSASISTSSSVSTSSSLP